jgi:hypothetical protein
VAATAVDPLGFGLISKLLLLLLLLTLLLVSADGAVCPAAAPLPAEDELRNLDT